MRNFALTRSSLVRCGGVLVIALVGVAACGKGDVERMPPGAAPAMPRPAAQPADGNSGAGGNAGMSDGAGGNSAEMLDEGAAGGAAELPVDMADGAGGAGEVQLEPDDGAAADPSQMPTDLPADTGEGAGGAEG